MLAPNAISIGRVKKSAAAVRTRDRETSIRNALARMRDASFSFFSPSRMPSSGAPPTPMREENAPIMVRMGPQTPTPASARSPTEAMWPMYIRSTMLYRTLTNCASMLGKAIRGTSFPIGSVPRWFTVFIEKYLVVF